MWAGLKLLQFSWKGLCLNCCTTYRNTTDGWWGKLYGFNFCLSWSCWRCIVYFRKKIRDIVCLYDWGTALLSSLRRNSASWGEGQIKHLCLKKEARFTRCSSTLAEILSTFLRVSPTTHSIGLCCQLNNCSECLFQSAPCLPMGLIFGERAHITRIPSASGVQLMHYNSRFSEKRRLVQTHEAPPSGWGAISEMVTSHSAAYAFCNPLHAFLGISLTKHNGNCSKAATVNTLSWE